MRKVRWRALMCCAVITAVRFVAVAPVGAAVVGAPASWVALYSAPGSYLGQSSQHLFEPSPTVAISASGTSNGVTVWVMDGGFPRYALNFAPIKGAPLSPGDYVDAQRASFRGEGHPGIDISGDGFGCNIDSGEFTVEDIAFDGGSGGVSGGVSRLAIAFDQRCQGGTAQFGELRYNETNTGPLTIKASAIVYPAQYVGVATPSVPLWVTNPGDSAVAVGAVTVGGAGADDLAIVGDDCPSTLGPHGTCTVTVTVTPRAVGLRHSTINVASNPSSVAVPVADVGIAGNAAFTLDSEPGEWVGAGQQFTWNQFNSKFSGGGSGAGSVSFNVDAGAHSYVATIAAPTGQTLAVGEYDDAQRTAFRAAGHPGIDIEGDGRGCNTVYGRFALREIAFDSNGLLVHFAADLEQHCEGGRPALFVSLRLGSSIGYSALEAQPPSEYMSFPDRLPGTSSPPQVVTVANTGALPLSISPTTAGTNRSDFQLQAPSCTAPIPSGASCSISLTFTPKGDGSREASLVINDSTPRGFRTITLNATGSKPPAFLYPTDGQVSVDTTRPLIWSTDPQVQAFYLVVGTTRGGAELVNSGALPRTQSSYNVPALPSGAAIYATLFSQVDGHWDRYQTITFTAMAQVAAFTSPVAGSFTADPTRPLEWTTSSQDQGYYLVVGTSPDSANLINSGVLPANQGSYAPPPMPANTTLYATLFTKWAGGWDHSQSIRFRYQAGEATFTSPLNGQRVVDAKAPITWSTYPTAQAYYLVVSTTPGGANLVNSGVLPTGRLYSPAVVFPKGVAIYATIFTEIGGSWAHYQTISFTAG